MPGSLSEYYRFLVRKQDPRAYISKGDQIGRIQGKNFIEILIKEHGLKHIKVPKKIAVVSKGHESISFRIARGLEIIPHEGHLTVYAERVTPLKRGLSLEEAIEFMIILEKTGYNDFGGQNFFFAKDGIYFIDTEFKDFSPTRPPMEAIEAMTTILQDPDDKAKFLVEYEKRKEAYEKTKETREAEINAYREVFKSSYKRLLGGHKRQEFTFDVQTL